MKKGESLYDTAKTFEAIGANILVVRHEADDWDKELRNKISIPIVSGGAGKKIIRHKVYWMQIRFTKNLAHLKILILSLLEILNIAE